MPRPKKPAGTNRVRINTTISPETAAAIESDRKPGDGLGQVIDRWAARETGTARNNETS